LFVEAPGFFAPGRGPRRLGLRLRQVPPPALEAWDQSSHRPSGVVHGSGLGKPRWVVERTFAWLHQFKRLRIRYEIRADLHLGLLQLACSIICQTTPNLILNDQ
jgi:transposase